MDKLIVEKFEKQYPVASPSFYNILSSIFFALNSLSIKYFDRIPATQIICWRSILTLLIISGLQNVLPNQSYPKKQGTMKKLILRGVIGSIGFINCFLSLKLVSVSEAVVLQKTNPLWTTFIVVYILKKERMTFKTMAEILICLLGVIFITKPPFLFGEENQIQMTSLYFLGLCLALFTAMTTSVVQVLISSLSKEVSALAILQYFSFFGIVACILYQLYSPFEQFQMVTLQEAGLLLVSGLLGCLGQLFMNRSVMIGNVTQQALIGESQIIFNIILDIVILNQTIETLSWLGISLIIGSLISNLMGQK